MFIFIWLSLFTFIHAFKVNRFCVDCKYYLHNPELWKSNKDFNGKCILFPKVETQNQTQFPSPSYTFDKYEYLVSGEVIEHELDYNECKTARQEESMCGERGKYYRNKYTYFKECFNIERLKYFERCKIKKRLDDITR
uniref:Uncharacterized protein n=1 Tax=viral metagenome TaxID=1070528 RepID=A0A6C0E6J8_9ZZZZ